MRARIRPPQATQTDNQNEPGRRENPRRLRETYGGEEVCDPPARGSRISESGPDVRTPARLVQGKNENILSLLQILTPWHRFWAERETVCDDRDSGAMGRPGPGW